MFNQRLHQMEHHHGNLLDRIISMEESIFRLLVPILAIQMLRISITPQMVGGAKMEEISLCLTGILYAEMCMGPLIMERKFRMPLMAGDVNNRVNLSLTQPWFRQVGTTRLALDLQTHLE